MRIPQIVKTLAVCTVGLLLTISVFGQSNENSPAAGKESTVRGASNTNEPNTSDGATVTKAAKTDSNLFAESRPRSAQPPTGDDDWHFESAPYLWMASLEGDMRVINNTVHVESSFSDVLKQLDFAFATRFEARKRRWTIMVDENYVNLGTVGTGPLGQTTEVEPTLNFFEAGMAFAAATVPNKNSSDAKPLPPVFVFEVLGGLRYTHFGLGLERTNLNVEGSRNLVDGFGGVRLKARPHPAVTLIPKFTIGGGGTNHTWTFSGLVDVRPKKSFSIWGGYQVMDMDADQTSNRVGFNGQMRGPIVGVTLYK